ncbi:MAG: hypothetical protein R2854_04520 [Caldilineaceae bacterium]
MAIDPQQRYQAGTALPAYLLPLVFLDCLGQSTAYHSLRNAAHKHFALFPFQIRIPSGNFRPSWRGRSRFGRAAMPKHQGRRLSPPRWNSWTTRDTCFRRVITRQRYFDDPQVAQS